jgi:hypothetical protein
MTKMNDIIETFSKKDSGKAQEILEVFPDWRDRP